MSHYIYISDIWHTTEQLGVKDLPVLRSVRELKHKTWAADWSFLLPCELANERSICLLVRGLVSVFCVIAWAKTNWPANKSSHFFTLLKRISFNEKSRNPDRVYGQIEYVGHKLSPQDNTLSWWDYTYTGSWGNFLFWWCSSMTLFPSRSDMSVFFSVLRWENYRWNYLLLFRQLSTRLVVSSRIHSAGIFYANVTSFWKKKKNIPLIHVLKSSWVRKQKWMLLYGHIFAETLVRLILFGSLQWLFWKHPERARNELLSKCKVFYQRAGKIYQTSHWSLLTNPIRIGLKKLNSVKIYHLAIPRNNKWSYK